MVRDNYLNPNPDNWHLLLSEVGNEFIITIVLLRLDAPPDQ